MIDRLGSLPHVFGSCPGRAGPERAMLAHGGLAREVELVCRDENVADLQPPVPSRSLSLCLSLSPSLCLSLSLSFSLYR